MSELIRDGLVNLSEDEIDAVAGGLTNNFNNFQGQQAQNFNRNQFGQATFGNVFVHSFNE